LGRRRRNVIKSFADKDTESIFHQEYVKGIPQDIQKRALRKLIMIDAAKGDKDFRVPPGNHFEHLQGDRLGQVSIRVNDQYRICFKIKSNDCYDVELVDYH